MPTHKERWFKAAHAMQSGVAIEMNHRSKPTDPKHLRVGINTALSDQAGLVKLLLDKGVFTEDEYLEAIANQMEFEQIAYEQRLSELIGAPVKLV